MYNAGKNGIAPVSKVWLSLYLFSWKLQLLNGSMWRSSLSNWIRIGQEMWKIRVELNFVLQWSRNFTKPVLTKLAHAHKELFHWISWKCFLGLNADTGSQTDGRTDVFSTQGLFPSPSSWITSKMNQAEFTKIYEVDRSVLVPFTVNSLFWRK